MLVMRFTLGTLMRTKGIETAYTLSKRTDHKIPISTAARLIDPEHPPTRIDFRTLDILCKALDVTPNQLLLPDGADEWPDPPTPVEPAVKKRTAPAKRGRKKAA